MSVKNSTNLDVIKKVNMGGGRVGVGSKKLKNSGGFRKFLNASIPSSKFVQEDTLSMRGQLIKTPSSKWRKTPSQASPV